MSPAEAFLDAKDWVAARAIAATWPSGTELEVFAAIAAEMGSSPRRLAHLARCEPWLRRLGHVDLSYRVRAVAAWSRGDYAGAAKAFRRAGTGEHPEWAVGAIDALARSGSPPQAIREANVLERRLLASGQAFDAGRAALNLGNALAWADRLPEAAAAYRRAIPRLAESPSLSAAATLGLSTSVLFMGDVAGAEAAARQAEASFSELDQDGFARMAAANLAYCDLLRGQPDEAYLRLRQIASDAVDDGGADRARYGFFLGEACLALNLWGEAVDRLRACVANEANLPRLNRADVRFSLARSLAAQGKLEEVPALLQNAARRYAALGNPVWQAACRLEMVRMGLTPGRALYGAIAVLERHRSRWLLADALLLRATAADLRRARALIRRHSFEGLRWRLEAALARTAPPRGRLARYRAMHRAMGQLRAGSSSISGRIAFYEDKRAALEAYLLELLRRPTPARLAEARQVIADTRSAALLDELGMARGDLDPELRRSLDALRASAPPDSGSNARRGPALEPPAVSAELALAPMSRIPRAHDRVVTFFQSVGSLSALHPGQTVELSRSAKQITDAVQWARFELFRPLVDPDFDGACPAMDRLASDLQRSFGDAEAVCPDGPLWNAPWTALFPDQAPSISLHPGFAPTAANWRLPENPRVLVWVGEFADLPHVLEELEVLRAAFPEATLCTSCDSARASLATGPWDILHVATHAALVPSSPLLSSFRFPDGDLYSLEVARSGLRVSLAVLSACDTGQMLNLGGSEPSGLVRAALACGAQAVVGSQWPLDDESASRLMTGMYGGLAKGNPLGLALAQSQRECRKWRKHPYYWASLALFNGYL